MTALDLLSGDARTFRDKVWASHVHLHRTDPDDLVGLLSLDDVDHLLTSVALRAPALRIAQDGTVLPTSAFTRSASLAGTPLTGLVDGRKVLELFDGGATVVLQGLHRYWAPLTELVRNLELELGHPCQANAYLTPPGSQGFARHSDSHDVFVFQTHGRKQWEVVEPDQQVREVLLEPGLSMYLPAGTPHSARSQDETSLHVTLGVNQITRRDLLRRLTEDVLSDERYDAALPAGYLQEPDRLADDLAAALAELRGSLDALEPVDVAEERATAFLTERTPALRGGLADRVALPSLADGTVVERRPTSACVLRPGPERLTVLLGDRALRMPPRLAGAMEFVRDHPSFAVADLAPFLDEASRLVVVRRLVREGLLRISA
ncbi:cupin domain-containing protein [Nocardioides mesophilus]|uniref:Cupin n=1 Tax=Nocardioides mesophilus TaxID=433659 RepID=A0A7G9R9Y2_9ACTN|nr:cupin domain-containing protein [Nocardioides mesophilus]QNN52407.1 cupin [Nocardioides mesophilus]